MFFLTFFRGAFKAIKRKVAYPLLNYHLWTAGWCLLVPFGGFWRFWGFFGVLGFLGEFFGVDFEVFLFSWVMSG